jgi:hypothetical protein
MYSFFIPKIANFSNQARKRLIKQALLRARGLDVNELGYARAMQMARGKAGQPIQSSSPFVRDLAKSNYLSDPGDLAYINRVFRDTLRNAPVDYGESGAMVIKTGTGIAPTAKEAKRSIQSLGVMDMGTNPGLAFLPPYLPLRNQARGVAMIHTHPLTDAATPSLLDAMAFSGIRGMTDAYSGTQSIIKPGAPIDAYVAHQTRPGKYDLVKYGDNPKYYNRKSRDYLFKADDATRQEMFKRHRDMITPSLKRMYGEDFPQEYIDNTAATSLVTAFPAVRKYNPVATYNSLMDKAPRVLDMGNNVPEDAVRSTTSSLWSRLKDDKDFLNQRKEAARIGMEAYRRMGFDAKYMGRYNVP